MAQTYNNPGRAELRKFGRLFGIFFIIVIGVILPLMQWGLGSVVANPGLLPRWPWYLGGLVLIWSLVHPASLHLLHRPWMKFAEIAGWINTHLIMVLLFYMLILPIGLIMRAFGHDPMGLRVDPKTESYRNARSVPAPSHMKHPY